MSAGVMKVKVIENRCERHPLQDPDVLEILDRPGYHRVVWKCPSCRQRWIARGTPESKQATSAYWMFGWRER